MRRQFAMGAMAMAMLLAACTGPESPATEAPCEANRAGRGKVVVHVWLEGDPDAPSISVRQPTCRLAPGTRLTWVANGPQARRLDAVSFADASPSDGGEARLQARDAGNRREIHMTARNVRSSQEFKYSVHAGATELDPIIIIDPR